MKSMHWLLIVLIVLITDCWYVKGDCTTLTPEESPYNIIEGDTQAICVVVSTDVINSTNCAIGDEIELTIDNNTDYETASICSDYEEITSPVNVTIAEDFNICFDVTTINDSAIESTEYINITISTDMTETNIIVFILDNNTLTFTVEDSVSIMEGSTQSVCVTANLPAGGLETTFNVTPIITNQQAMDDDYTITNQPLTFGPSNDSTIMQCITITAINDSIAEVQETFNITWDSSLASVSFSPTTTQVIIEGHLTTSLSNSTVINGTEGGLLTLCLQLNGNDSVQHTYPYAVIPGTATANEDYDPSSGNIIIESGTEIGCTSIQLMDDAIVEETEMFIISFTTADINVTVNIKDDNNASIGFNEYNASVDETIRMYSTQLEITPPDTTIAVGFYVSVTYMNGTAMFGEDFMFVDNNSVYWAESVPPTINVTILDNDIVECDESFTLSIAVTTEGLNISTSIAQQKITIVDNDMSTIFTPVMLSYDESEGTINECFYHTKQLAPKRDNSSYILSYNVTDGTATAGGVDYTISSNSTIIPLLPSDKICIMIVIEDDMIVEGMETFVINWNLDGVLLNISLNNSVTTVTIQDNDFPPSSSTTPTATVGSSSAVATPTATVGSSSAIIGTYAIIGIIVGVVAAGVCFLLILTCIICCVRIKMNRQGFYTTNEDKGEAPQMLRYSASLRSLQSQTVMPADPRDKENEYMV